MIRSIPIARDGAPESSKIHFTHRVKGLRVLGGSRGAPAESPHRQNGHFPKEFQRFRETVQHMFFGLAKAALAPGFCMILDRFFWPDGST